MLSLNKLKSNWLIGHEDWSFHFYGKMSSSPFLTEIIFVWKTISQSISSLQRQNYDFILFVWTSWRISLLNLKYSVVQQQKKIGSQQKQKREAKSNNIDCHLQGLCCHEETSLAFHSALEIKHESLKKVESICPINCFLCVWFSILLANYTPSTLSLTREGRSYPRVLRILLLWNGPVWVP